MKCEATTTRGAQCTRNADGIGTHLCQQHHELRFGEVARTMPSGCIAGRVGYIGSHGHLNR